MNALKAHIHLLESLPKDCIRTHHRREYRPEPKERYQHRENVYELFVEMKGRRIPNSEVCSKLHISTGTARLLRERAAAEGKLPAQWEKRPVDEKDVARYVELKRAGMRYRAIVRLMRVSQKTLARIAAVAKGRGEVSEYDRKRPITSNDLSNYVEMRRRGATTDEMEMVLRCAHAYLKRLRAKAQEDGLL